jgi:hypothetical protein
MEMTFFGKKNKDPENGRGRERRGLRRGRGVNIKSSSNVETNAIVNFNELHIF